MGKRTKDLIKTLEPGDVAVIDHADLDRVAADGLVEARVTAAKLLAPRTVDPEKTKAIEDHFPPGSFRERALSAFVIYQ